MSRTVKFRHAVLLVIANGVEGLLSLDAQGLLIPLTTAANGVPFGFTD